MASSNSLNSLFATLLIGGFSSSAMCESTDVYQQGNSTAIIKQSGSDNNINSNKNINNNNTNSSSSSSSSSQKEIKVTKTKNTQKIITRSGNNTDITIQSTGNPGRFDSGAADSSAIRQPTDSDRFTRGSRGLPDCNADKSCDRNYDAPTEDEFKDRVNRRMRPL